MVLWPPWKPVSKRSDIRYEGLGPSDAAHVEVKPRWNMYRMAEQTPLNAIGLAGTYRAVCR